MAHCRLLQVPVQCQLGFRLRAGRAAVPDGVHLRGGPPYGAGLSRQPQGLALLQPAGLVRRSRAQDRARGESQPSTGFGQGTVYI